MCLALAAVVGCGSDDDEPAAQEDPRLVVSAAASLSDALTACSKEFEGADVKLSFAGSDELAAQIRQGVKPDVYAAANTRLPEELNQEGLLGTLVEFATNELVIAARRRHGGGAGGGPRQARHRPRDRRRVGACRLVHPRGARAAAHGPRGEDHGQRRPEEPDVKGVVGKLTQDAADAGFVYLTDVTEGITGVELPPELRPTVAYGAGVVEGSKQPELAQQYLDGLTEGPCADALREEGFGPPPSG